MTPPASPQRRADLDWIRVAAFGLLILFHVSLVYAPWDWHVHSKHTFAWLEEATAATGPWRLTLLFLVSGAALRFMSRRYSPVEVLRARMIRLLPPLLFGVLVLVPPQSWLEATDKGSFGGGLAAWWLREFSPSGLADGVPVNHLWFVEYIVVYSLAAVALMTRPAWIAALERGVERWLSGWRLLVLPILFFVLARQLVFPPFGQTNQLFGDWYNHLTSLGAFLFGFVVAGREAVWKTFEAQRWMALALALVSTPLLMALTAHPGGLAFDGWVKHGMHGVEQWSAIAAILGFGSRHLRGADGPLLRYLTDAVFPCYLAHQTLLVIAVRLVKPIDLPAPVEAAILVSATLGGSLLVYELARRSGPLRPLWGLRRHPAVRAAPPP
ncbi:MAG TPA: acyltransferase family protein, partial [Caulobacter sp.]|nr:acyltransferase family protein [Caulobacter sp.]